MKFVVKSLALTLVVGMAACANNTTRPTDVGSMQQPNFRGGTADQSPLQGRDVGSMQYPQTSGGLAVPAQTAPDTGSMAVPSYARGNGRPGSITP